MKPTIGVTRCSRLDDYLASVEQAGGRPRVLEVSESPRKVLDEIDGLLLTGGGDVDPVLYGEDRHPTIDDAEPGRDEFEIDLARRAMDERHAAARDLPRRPGSQRRRRRHARPGHPVARDVGPLAQHHRAEERRRACRQRRAGVAARTGARQRVDASHTCRVNSRHHQSVGRLGAGLIPSATAPDGIVEAIESAPPDGVLPRRAVAPGELLAHRRILAAVRIVRRRRPRRPSRPPSADREGRLSRTSLVRSRLYVPRRQTPKRLDVRRVGKEIEPAQRLQGIAAVEQPSRIPRHRRGIAGDVDDPRGTIRTTDVIASGEMPVRGGSTIRVSGRDAAAGTPRRCPISRSGRSLGRRRRRCAGGPPRSTDPPLPPITSLPGAPSATANSPTPA